MLTSSDFEFEFREPQSLPNPMLAFDGLACGYTVPPVAGHGDTPPEGVAAGSGRPGGAGGTPKAIVSGIDRSVLAGQRIGILGANGQGKSTLVKTIAGDLQAIAGEVTTGKGLTIGYFAQAEFYFDCDKGWNDSECNGGNGDNNATFAIKWRARLRHLELPNFGALLGNFGLDAIMNSGGYEAIRDKGIKAD